MKKRVILSLVVLVVVIAGSTLLYNKLMGEVQPPDMLTGIGTDQSLEAESNTPVAESTEAGGPGSENTAPNIDAGQPDAQAAEQVKAPDFTVQDAEGNPVKLSDMLGKPIVLNFWASWCPPCKSEMPEFNKVHEELGDEVQFMMVDAVDGNRETKRTGEAYIASEGYTFPVYFDMEQEAVVAYGLRAFPTSIFIDREGYIVAGIEGAIDEATLRRGIEMIR